MGKYMKKGKITGDVAVMEIPQSSSSLGVRTRARTLALQPNPELSYLQLRNRRLEKPPFQPPLIPNTTTTATTTNKKGRENSRVRVGSGSGDSEKGQGHFGKIGKVVVVGRCDGGGETEDFHDVGTEPSCGENNLDFDSRERSTRESTPCSLIRDADIGTPGSATRPTCSASVNRRTRSMQRAIPTTPEMEEFFAGFEQHQRKQFIEKYNYDILNDLPLPGRYEWVRVDN